MLHRSPGFIPSLHADAAFAGYFNIPHEVFSKDSKLLLFPREMKLFIRFLNLSSSAIYLLHVISTLLRQYVCVVREVGAYVYVSSHVSVHRKRPD